MNKKTSAIASPNIQPLKAATGILHIVPGRAPDKLRVRACILMMMSRVFLTMDSYPVTNASGKADSMHAMRYLAFSESRLNGG